MAFSALDLAAGDSILVPSYNCGSEVDPLIWVGARPLLYRVDSSARIDLDDLAARCTTGTRAVYVTHYFGWSQPMRELVSFCRERGLALFEDCALSLFSEGPEGPLGTAGGAAVFCLWKTLPVPDGAVLTLAPAGRWPGLAGTHSWRAPPATDLARRTRPFIRRWVRSKAKALLAAAGLRRPPAPLLPEVGRAPTASEEPRRDMPADYYFDGAILDRRMSRISTGLANLARREEIVEKRRRNYRRIFDSLQGLESVRPLFPEMPDGVCPLVMPVLVADRSYWMRELNAGGVHPFPWWRGYHRALSLEEFPEARMLKSRLLAFPVDQCMTEDDLARLIARAQAVARRAAPLGAAGGPLSSSRRDR